MSEAEARKTKSADPWEALRGLRDVYMDLWSKSMSEAVKTEGYAEMSGAMLDSYLALSAPYRETFEKTVSHTLQQLGLPTSADLAGLAGRLTNIEMRLDDMDAKLDRIEKLLVQPGYPDTIDTKPASSEKPITRLEQVADLNERLDGIEKQLMQSEADRHKEQVESTRLSMQVTPVTPEAPKHSTATKPSVKAPPAREAGGKTLNVAQQASTAKNRRDAGKGVE
jgi:hypothetical protein